MVDLPAEGTTLEIRRDGADRRSSVRSREPSVEPEATVEEEELKVEAEHQVRTDDVEVLEGEEDDTDDKERREELIQQYQALIQKRDKVQQHNVQLQNKLYEYFRRKKGEDLRPETDKRISDQEQQYLKYLTSLENMKKKNVEDAAMCQQQMEELRAQCLEVKRVALLAYKQSGAGKHALSAFIEAVTQLQAKEDRKEKEVTQVNLENIKLKNLMHQFQSTLRSKEELTKGLHLIDFQQLKIETQTYNEKIEAKNRELLKLQKKITSTVHTLTHLKQQSGLLDNKLLLKDFEDKVDSTEVMSQKLESLKRLYAEQSLSSKGLMKKTEEGNLALKD
ncbi:hypothetical protein XELAEV_18005089mg [Xenopus laevis]|uniref:CCDC113/CCDC96 coiled-coil domain-containing protein n=1 Tax=Xenopus laevis TaxID=8355 RepID=A0A974I2B9_XENLA|nr:hypothetical protein XELAEV_18005089mg [Xenopus laevis]